MTWASLAGYPLTRRCVRTLLATWPLPELAWRFPNRLLTAIEAFAAPREVFGLLPNAEPHAIVVTSHELSATGAPKALLEIIVASRSMGWAVVVVAPADGPYRELFVAAGAAVIVSPEALTRCSVAIGLCALADVLLCNTIVAAEVVRAVRSRLPIIWYLHENGLLDAMAARDASLIALIRKASVVWASSELTADRVRRLGGQAVVLEACSAPLVATLADLPALVRAPVARFCVLGSIEPRKGQDVLFDAIQRLPAAVRSCLHVDIYGKPLDAVYTERLLGRLAAMPEIRYGGLLAPTSISAVIIGCDAVIVPSRDEPLSLVAVEAMSAGRVVICSKRCGIARYLTDGVDGFIADDCRPEDLAALINAAMARRADWQAIGEAGRRVYDQHFTPERFRGCVRSTLRGLVGPDG